MLVEINRDLGAGRMVFHLVGRANERPTVYNRFNGITQVLQKYYTIKIQIKVKGNRSSGEIFSSIPKQTKPTVSRKTNPTK